MFNVPNLAAKACTAVHLRGALGVSTGYIEVVGVQYSMRAYSSRSIGSKLSLPLAIAYFTVALTADILGAHFIRSEGAFPPRKKERHPFLASVSRNS